MRLIRPLLAALLILAAPLVPAQPVSEPILVISRERVLTEAQAAVYLNRNEARLTDQLQIEVDALKAALASEEQELTRLRGTLDREEFDRRVTDFDQRVRRERRQTQRRAAALQTAFRRARAELAEALVPILVEISRERGAKLVLNRDQILLAHPSIDVTDMVIERMDAKVPLPELPAIEPAESAEPEAGGAPAQGEQPPAPTQPAPPVE